MPSIQDRLMAHVMALTANGGRNVGTTGHYLARDYIATRLKLHLRFLGVLIILTLFEVMGNL